LSFRTILCGIYSKFLLCSLFQRALDYFHLGIETPRLKDKLLLIEDIAKPINGAEEEQEQEFTP
jgi:hypothetical protein